MRRKVFGWQVVLSLQIEWYRGVQGWRTLTVGVYKQTSDPPQGQYMVRGENYRGFLFQMHVWIPFEVKQWR